MQRRIKLNVPPGRPNPQLRRFIEAVNADDEPCYVQWLFSAEDNPAIRAALIAFAFNLLMVVAAIVSIMLTVPRGRKRGDTH